MADTKEIELNEYTRGQARTLLEMLNAICMPQLSGWQYDLEDGVNPDDHIPELVASYRFDPDGEGARLVSFIWSADLPTVDLLELTENTEPEFQRGVMLLEEESCKLGVRWE